MGQIRRDRTFTSVEGSIFPFPDSNFSYWEVPLKSRDFPYFMRPLVIFALP